MLSLNERDLLEILVSENYWKSTFGALEYDPEVFMPNWQSNNYTLDRNDLSPSHPKYRSLTSNSWCENDSIVSNLSSN
jgi:hypothetical protein